MSSVCVKICGGRGKETADDIAGVSPAFYHPLGRYCEDPYHNASPLQPIRPLLGKAQTRLISLMHRRLEMDRYARLLFFHDQWRGQFHNVLAKIGQPTGAENVSLPVRYVFVAHDYAGDSDTYNQFNELLIQVEHSGDDVDSWMTAAAVGVQNGSRNQLGFADPDLLPERALQSEDVLDAATAAFLNHAVTHAFSNTSGIHLKS